MGFINITTRAAKRVHIAQTSEKQKETHVDEGNDYQEFETKTKMVNNEG
jgi:hypothetical protein